MKTVLTKLAGVRRACVVLCGLVLLALHPLATQAFSPAHFASLQSQIHSELSALSALPTPTREERLFLRTVERGSNVLNKISATDGRTLRSLNRLFGRRLDYLFPLATVRSNLLLGFNAEQTFVANLLPELPDSADTTAAKEQYHKFIPRGTALNEAPTIARFSGLYDGTKRRLDDLLIRANQALLIPFPTNLPTSNSVSAMINGVNFRSSRGAATDNVFTAVRTETNVCLTLGALANSGGSGLRGIYFNIPNAAPGSFRHAIPGAAVFTNRTGIYSTEENNLGATNGAIFINATATEVYGVFSCSGPGFNITDGTFRITISSQP